MTTGRINQVTTAGNGERAPRRSAPSRTGRTPTSAKLDDGRVLHLQGLPHRTLTAGREPAAPRPVPVHAGAVDLSVDPNVGHHSIARPAKRCNPQVHSPAPNRWTTHQVQPPAHTQLLSKPGNASAGSRQPHTAPRQFAQQKNVSVDSTARLAPGNATSHAAPPDAFSSTPHGVIN